MSNSYISDPYAEVKSEYLAPNNITVALALNGKRLTKIVYTNPINDVDYDSPYYYKFFNRDVYGLSDILELVKILLNKKDCCVIRGVCKDDSLSRQRRLFHGCDATIIEQKQNWYALDVDKYGASTGDLKRDTQAVLLALGLQNVEAFAIPSSGYLRKPGIRIRLFLWNSVKISSFALKKYYKQYENVVDSKLFHPIQPIYIARPIFNGFTDPCNKHIVWITGSQMYTEIPTIYNDSNRNIEYHQKTAKQAKAWLDKIIRSMKDVSSGDRHDWLYKEAIGIAKPCLDGVLDEEETKEELYDAAYIWWQGNRKKDRETIEYAFRDALKNKDGNNGQF